MIIVDFYLKLPMNNKSPALALQLTGCQPETVCEQWVCIELCWWQFFILIYLHHFGSDFFY